MPSMTLNIFIRIIDAEKIVCGSPFKTVIAEQSDQCSYADAYLQLQAVENQ